MAKKKEEKMDETTKELTINGKVYAKYEVENDILYLKPLIQLLPGEENAIKSEDLLAYIIQLVEHVEVKGLAYLNV